MLPGVVRPRSCGRVRITGANPSDPVEIDAGTFSDPADFKAMVRAIQIAARWETRRHAPIRQTRDHAGPTDRNCV
jgi:choline dehydrogenase